MYRKLKILTAALAAAVLPAAADPGGADLKSSSLSELEQQLAEVGTELSQLAYLTLRSGIGAVGNRSQTYTNAFNTEWVQIDFEENRPLDSIVLIPSIWRHVQKGSVDDAFPKEFRIVAGLQGDTNGVVIAHRKMSGAMLPRVAPLIIPCPGTTAGWIRVEALELAPRHLDGKYIFQLSEILVFNGEQNIALHRPVSASSPTSPFSRNWQYSFLVDGFLPYLMNAAQGEKSLAFVSSFQTEPLSTDYITFDLGTEMPVSRIHIHPIDQSDTVPQSSAGDFGFPRHFTAEAASTADFSDAVTLLDYRAPTVYQTGPVMMWNIPETDCRFIRFRFIETYSFETNRKTRSRLGFAEFEIFSGGRNVVLGKPFETSLTTTDPSRKTAAINDGRNLYGNILPIRSWLEQLARRHDLETLRPAVQTELSRRYARQKANLRRLGWLSGILVAGSIIIILIEKGIRDRAVFQTRERIAANLHDELGANLHAIGLLGDLAKDEVDAAGVREELDELVDIVEEIRTVTEKTGAAARYCTNMLETPGLYENLVEEMSQISKLLLADLEHDFSVENGDLLQNLKRRANIDIYLFYKECLTNIIRHSGATRVSTRIRASKKALQLTVTDNGRGLAPSRNNGIPAALKRRSRFLGARLEVSAPEDGGTCVKLTYRPGKFKLTKRR